LKVLKLAVSLLSKVPILLQPNQPLHADHASRGW
jgi:hypothetical protein